MKNTILTFGIVLSMLFAMPALPVHAEIINSGACGENLAWTLDDSGTLTISGTGEMREMWDAPWYILRSSIKTVVIQDGVTSIGNGAFSGCDSLTSITIPDGVTSIGDSAFYGCYNLTTISIPDSVTTIGSYAFKYCGITSITIPKNVTSIDDLAFYYSHNLHSTNVSEENTKYLSYDGCLYNKEKKILVFCPYDKENCAILDGTTKISREVFFEHYLLKTITIPSSVEAIGRFAFCFSLTDIYFQGSEMEWLNILRNGESDFNSYYRECCLQIPCVHFDYSGETLTLDEGDVFKISETTTVNNLHINAADGFVKTSCKTITGEKINFDGNGKMYLDSGYTAKIERDHSETATTQGFMVGLTNPNDTVTIVLEVTGTSNDVDYTGRTITQRFDFSGYEIEGLVNFGVTVCNIPKPLSLTLKSIE